MSQCHDVYETSGYPEPEEPATEAVPSCHDDYRPVTAGGTRAGSSGAGPSEKATAPRPAVAGRSLARSPVG